jgi:hypothetical protein
MTGLMRFSGVQGGGRRAIQRGGTAAYSSTNRRTTALRLEPPKNARARAHVRAS